MISSDGFQANLGDTPRKLWTQPTDAIRLDQEVAAAEHCGPHQFENRAINDRSHRLHAIQCKSWISPSFARASVKDARP